MVIICHIYLVEWACLAYALLLHVSTLLRHSLDLLERQYCSRSLQHLFQDSWKYWKFMSYLNIQKSWIQIFSLFQCIDVSINYLNNLIRSYSSAPAVSHKFKFICTPSTTNAFAKLSNTKVKLHNKGFHISI